MELEINKMRIQLINLVEDCRRKGVPTYVISGILAEEQLRMKSRELSEFTVTMNNQITDLNSELEKAREAKDGQGVSESN